MASPPFMPLYIGDYLSDTRHLTTEQHGAYLLILMAMWRTGGRLPKEGAKLARIAGLTPAKWSKLEDEILAFFEVCGDEIGHKRIEKEFIRYTKTCEKRTAAGSRGGSAKSLKMHEPDVASDTILPEANDKPGHGNQNQNQNQKEESDDDDKAREPACETSSDKLTIDWSARLEEAKTAGGDALNLTIGSMHVFRDLKTLCEPISGEPCLWEEVLDAIRVCATRHRSRGKQIRSWTWVAEEAFAFRDRRLAGVRELQSLAASAPTFADRLAAEKAEARRRVLEG